MSAFPHTVYFLFLFMFCSSQMNLVFTCNLHTPQTPTSPPPPDSHPYPRAPTPTPTPPLPMVTTHTSPHHHHGQHTPLPLQIHSPFRSGGNLNLTVSAATFYHLTLHFIFSSVGRRKSLALHPHMVEDKKSCLLPKIHLFPFL